MSHTIALEAHRCYCPYPGHQPRDARANQAYVRQAGRSLPEYVLVGSSFASFRGWATTPTRATPWEPLPIGSPKSRRHQAQAIGTTSPDAPFLLVTMALVTSVPF